MREFDSFMRGANRYGWPSKRAKWKIARPPAIHPGTRSDGSDCKGLEIVLEAENHYSATFLPLGAPDDACEIEGGGAVFALDKHLEKYEHERR